MWVQIQRLSLTSYDTLSKLLKLLQCPGLDSPETDLEAPKNFPNDRARELVHLSAIDWGLLGGRGSINSLTFLVVPLPLPPAPMGADRLWQPEKTLRQIIVSLGSWKSTPGPGNGKMWEDIVRAQTVSGITSCISAVSKTHLKGPAHSSPSAHTSYQHYGQAGELREVWWTEPSPLQKRPHPNPQNLSIDDLTWKKGTLQMWLNEGSWNGKMILDCPVGSNVITGSF